MKRAFASRATSAVAAVLLTSIASLQAGVVINEILYNAPNDLDQLEYVELLNHGSQPADLSGWKLTKAVKFTFPAHTTIPPSGYVVVCKNRELFSRFFDGIVPVGEYTKSLGNGSDKVNLKNAEDSLVDSIEYDDRSPWPVSADGYSASLERICPSARSDDPANWAPSALSDDYDKKPSGSPGKQNSTYSRTAAPVITGASTDSPHTYAPGSPLAIRAEVSGAKSVTLLYQVVEPGSAGDETPVAMTKKSGDRYSASIPGQSANRIVRFRVKALGDSGAVRFFPHQNEIRPALSVYVTDPVEVGAIPIAHFFNIGEDEFKKAAQYRADSGRSRGRGGFGGFGRREFSEEDRARMDAERQLRTDALATAWGALTLKDQPSKAACTELVEAFRKANGGIAKLREGLENSKEVVTFAKSVPEKMEAIGGTLKKDLSEILGEEELALLPTFHQSLDNRDRGFGRRGFGGDGRSMLQRFFDIERSWFEVSMNADVDVATLGKVFPVMTAAIEKRDSTETGELDERGRPDFRAMMEAIEPQREELNTALASALGGERAVADLGLESRSPFGRGAGRRGSRGFGRDRGSSTPLRPQGLSAFIYTDPKTKETQLFDFVNIVQRKSGYKVRLHKDRPLNGMTTINVLYEPNEETILNESLAYGLYGAAGNATQRSGYTRVVMDGKVAGYHVWFEQPNGAFFRHNEIDDDGNLYKVTWQGTGSASEYTPKDKRPKKRSDVVRRHEKISNPHDGYDDLIELVEALDNAAGDEALWKMIQERFEVDQVINYFAINALLSHWDGFFNNYFLYHDVEGSGKWSMYPWDQDSTWSQRMGNVDELSKMPLNYGASDASPPGRGSRDRDRGRRGFGRGGFGWWRDGGEISSPLLANPQFRKRYYARLKTLCESEFTQEAFAPQFKDLQAALEPEVKLRAETYGRNADDAVESLRNTLASMAEHLEKRREFILAELSR